MRQVAVAVLGFVLAPITASRFTARPTSRVRRVSLVFGFRSRTSTIVDGRRTSVHASRNHLSGTLDGVADQLFELVIVRQISGSYELNDRRSNVRALDAIAGPEGDHTFSVGAIMEHTIGSRTCNGAQCSVYQYRVRHCRM